MSFPDFTQRGASVFNDETLSLRARVCYGVMLKYADMNGNCSLRLQTLREEMQVSTSVVTRVTKELVAGKIVRRTRIGRFGAVLRFTLLR